MYVYMIFPQLELFKSFGWVSSISEVIHKFVE